MNKFFFVPFISLVLSFISQTYIIFPIEQYIRSDGMTSLVSLVFIPHGVKVLVVMVYGLWSLPAIFMAQIINGIMFNGAFELNTLYGAFAGTTCIGLPLVLYNLSLNRNLFLAPMFDKTFDFNVFWLFMSWAIIASFLNSLLHSLIYSFPSDNLPLYFLFGDVFGALVFCLLSLTVLHLYSPLRRH